jgi:hypothetical protein
VRSPGRRESVTGICVTLLAGREAGMVHRGTRTPGCPDRMALATSATGHWRLRVRQRARAGHARLRRHRVRHIMAPRRITGRCRGHALVIKRRRQPASRCMTGGALQCSHHVIGFRRPDRPATGVTGITVATRAVGDAGMVHHGSRPPYRADHVASGTGGIGHRRHGMVQWTPRLRNGLASCIVTSGLSTVGRCRHTDGCMIETTGHPGRRRMADRALVGAN